MFEFLLLFKEKKKAAISLRLVWGVAEKDRGNGSCEDSPLQNHTSRI